MENLKQKTYNAFAWDFLGKISGQTVSFIISIFLARLLSPDDFGLLAMVNVIIAISGSLMDMGLGLALIQGKNINEKHYNSVFFFNFSVGLVLAALLFFSSGFIAVFYNNELTGKVTQVMSVIFILNSFGNVARVKLRKELDFKIPFQANILSAIISGTIGIVMAFLNYGVWSLVIQSLLSPVVNNGYLFYATKWSPKLKLHIKELKELWSFGFSMFIASIIDTIYNQIDSLIIGKLFSPGQLGYYFRAKSFNNYIISYSSGSILNVLLPVISKIQDNLEKLKEVVFKSMHLICFITFYLLGLFYLTGGDLILLLFGSKWEASVLLFRLFLLAGYVYPISALLVNIIVGMGNSKGNLRLEIFKKILFSFSFIIGFQFGIEGFLVAYAIAGVLAVLLNLFFASRQLQVKISWLGTIVIKYLLLCFTITVLIFFVLSYFQKMYFLHLCLSFVAFTSVYYFFAKIFKMKGETILIDELKHYNIPHRIKKILKR